MARYFMGADIGGTKTHVLIADENGHMVGFGEAGPGNHEAVGYTGFKKSLRTAFNQAAAAAGVSSRQIAGAGFGVAGYDWPSEEQATRAAIGVLGLEAPVAAYNDTIIGLMAGASEGWGIAVVSGTGCNCWGWDRTRQQIGHVTGGGIDMGEGAGGTELVFKAVQAVAYEWTQRGPQTALAPAFLRRTGAQSLPDLLEGLMNRRYALSAADALLVFEAAAAGDAVALELVRWAGRELGELARAVIRQLKFEELAFEVVLVGSMYEGSPLLIETMRQTVQALAPAARLVRLATPPVVGAVLLGMEQVGMQPGVAVREELKCSTLAVRKNGLERV